MDAMNSAAYDGKRAGLGASTSSERA